MNEKKRSPWLMVTLGVLAMTVGYTTYLVTHGELVSANAYSCSEKHICDKSECKGSDACSKEHCGKCPACAHKAS